MAAGDVHVPPGDKIDMMRPWTMDCRETPNSPCSHSPMLRRLRRTSSIEHDRIVSGVPYQSASKQRRYAPFLYAFCIMRFPPTTALRLRWGFLLLLLVPCPSNGFAPNSGGIVSVRILPSSTTFVSRIKTSLYMYADEPNPTGPGLPLAHGSTNVGADDFEADDNSDEEQQKREHFLDESGHPIEEKRIDYPGAGTLGDIMSSDEGFRVAPTDDDGAVVPKEDDTTTFKDYLRDSALSPSHDPAAAAATSTAPVADEGLVTTAGGTLQARFGSKIPAMSPLERIALTSNGNLQRIFSSYYDAPVHVHVDRCEMREAEKEEDRGDEIMAISTSNGFPDPQQKLEIMYPTNGTGETSNGSAVWDRKVHLSVHSKRFCTATSVVTVRSPDCIRLVHSNSVGIGQLFRYLDRLPTFSLLDAGRTEDGGMWRSYALECDELSCLIQEEFSVDAWRITPPV